MVSEVSNDDMKSLAEKLMTQLKTEGDIDAFTKALRKQFWEASLEGRDGRSSRLFQARHSGQRQR